MHERHFNVTTQVLLIRLHMNVCFYVIKFRFQINIQKGNYVNNKKLTT